VAVFGHQLVADRIRIVKGKVTVKQLEEVFVTHPLNVIEVLERGESARHVGMTDWNERSSRSHTIFTMVRTRRVSQIV
jgi:centromeric protein E